MSTPKDGADRLVVGALSFDPSSGELTGPRGVERVAPQPAALLALLASRPGEVVTRDEIRGHLWPGGRVDFEQGIAFAVREVRKAIEATGGDPGVLETIPKRGFRIGAAGPADAGSAAIGPDGQASSTPPSSVARGESSRTLVRPLVMLAVVVAGAVAVLAREGPESLPAVVVFVHEAQDDAHADIARAVGFEITTALTSAFAGRLGVVGPTGTATLSGPDDTEGARASLGACLVVSGGIRALGADTLVVFTQIVRTDDRFHAWAAQDTVPLATAAAVVAPHVAQGVEIAAEAC